MTKGSTYWARTAFRVIGHEKPVEVKKGRSDECEGWGIQALLKLLVLDRNAPVGGFLVFWYQTRSCGESRHGDFLFLELASA
jgi:hypothetical protein